MENREHLDGLQLSALLAVEAWHKARTARTEQSLREPGLRAFHDKVKMVLDPEIDRAYPKRWMGRVTVKTRDGKNIDQRIGSPKGDPDNTLTRAELEDKALRLAAHSGAATEAEMKKVIARVWRLHEERDVRDFLAKK